MTTVARACRARAQSAAEASATWRRYAAIVFPIAAFAVLAVVVAGRRDAFAEAIDSAPLWLLAAVVVLQLVALLSRSEAWHQCVGAAGSTVPRRGVFQASGIGGLGSIVNGQLGMAARIATLRRSSPSQCPRVGALIAAEVPIVAVEVSLAALTRSRCSARSAFPGGPPCCASAARSARCGG